MTMRTPAAVAASLLLSGCLVLSGCSLLPGGDDKKPSPSPTADRALPNTAWKSAPRDKLAGDGTLRLAVTAMPRNFNPLHTDSAGSDVDEILAPTTGAAIRPTADGGWQVDHDYAESVRIADSDPLTVEVRLNREAVWQGGTPITAKDMVAFWKAQNGSDDDFEVRSTVGYEDIADVEPGKGGWSYAVTFKKPTADWPQYIYPRLPAKVSSSPKRFNTAFTTRPISSNGPYLVAGIDAKTGTITEKRNPRWWGAKPKLSTISWRIATPAVQAKAYAAGELDAVDLVADTYATAKDTGKIQRAAGVEWTQLTLNGARGPLKDVDVRRAVAHAVDREAIATESAARLGAKGVPLGSLIQVPGQKGYVDSSAAIAYDPKEASRLLADAGYAKGADGVLARKGKPLTLTMPVPDKTSTITDRAQRVAEDLKAVGIEVRLRPVPADTFFDTYVIPLDFDLVTFTWRASAFPVTAAEPLFYPVDSAQNFTGQGDAGLGKAWAKAIRTLDDAKRAKLVRKLDERLLKDVPVVPIAVTPAVMAVRAGVVNYGASQFERPDWTAVGFTKPAKKK